jgi:ankyrin repeat protein
VVQTLVAAGTSVAIRDRYTGNTPLHWLALHHAPQPWAAAVARLLLDNGADGRVKNHDKHTPAGRVPAGPARDLLTEAGMDAVLTVLPSLDDLEPVQ